MALLKENILDNGIVLSYHRITSIINITNVSTTFEISSYVNNTKRLEEKIYQDLQMKKNRTLEEEEQLAKGINVFIETNYVQIPYNENITISNAYDYLKTIDEYKDAQDI